MGSAERVTVVRHGDSYQATARLGAWWTVGDYDSDMIAAIESACMALEMILPERSQKSLFEDILGA